MVGCFISVYSLFFFITNKVYLIGSDAFYYMALSDSLLDNGIMRDIVTIPSGDIKTPQNGIVFVHLILSLLGIGAKGKILSIVIFNYLLYISGVYPLYKIASILGLNNNLRLVILQSVYLSAWHIYRINLLIINDGIFNSLILWFIYLIIMFVKHVDILKSFSFPKHILLKLSVIFLLEVALIQFRLNIILVIMSALISLLLVKKFKAFVYLTGCSLLLIISVISIFSFIEVTHLKNSGIDHFFNMFYAINVSYIKLQLWKILPRLILGISGLSNPLLSLFFLVFPLSTIYFGIRGIVEKNFIKIFLTMICLTGLWFTMHFQNARLIWYTFPFFYLIILTLKRVRYVGLIFVLLIYLQSFQQFYIGIARVPESKLFLYMYENNISLPINNPLLLTSKARHAYFLLNTRSYRVSDASDGILDGKIVFPVNFNWDLIVIRKTLFILGDREFINSAYSQIHDMAISNGYTLESHPLTPYLDEFEGWALAQIKLKQKI